MWKAVVICVLILAAGRVGWSLYLWSVDRRLERRRRENARG